MNKTFFIPLVIVFFAVPLIAALPVIAQEKKSEAQEKPLAEKVFERLVAESLIEIAKIHQADLDRLIDQQAKFFKLESKKVKKLKILGKNLVAAQANRYTQEMFLDRWKSINQRVALGTTFVMNGRTCVLDGEKKEKVFAQMTVKVQGQLIILSVQAGLAKAGTLLSPTKKFEPLSDPKWMKAIAPLTEKDLKRFDQHVTQLQKQEVLKVLLPKITKELQLTQKQIPIVKKWIESSVAKIPVSSLDSAVKSVVRLLPRKAPQDLTSEQQKAWPALRAKLLR